MKRQSLTPLKRNSCWLVPALCLVLCVQSQLPGAATFTVTKTADSGTGTLRAAITSANVATNQATIVFNISGGAGVKTISLLSPLPDITNSVFIDGWSQGGTGYTGPPLIELNGNHLSGYGLDFYSGTNTVRGLIINQFFFPQIQLNGNGFNTIQGNYIGTDPTGVLGRNSDSSGISIFQSGYNLIGGTNASERNVISGNFNGIEMDGGFSHFNVIQGNYIGLNAAGTAAVSNFFSGIQFLTIRTNENFPTDNTIGGSVPGARNVISGNSFGGMRIGATSSNIAIGPTRNRIIGNYIGTDKDGLHAIPNGGPGILLSNCTANVIGGLSANERNLISGNDEDGILIGGGRSNVVEGNWIGLDATGEGPLANLVGVSIFGGSNNVIGGIGEGNVISGNTVDGMEIGFGAQGNRVFNNVIGADPDVQAHVPNFGHGVLILSGTNNLIGGSAGFANYIVGNTNCGIFIRGGVSNVVLGNTIAENSVDGVQLNTGAMGNQILGNVIGAGPGIGALELIGNQRHGVAVFDSTNNIIGGAEVTNRNYISGNNSNGVFLGIGALGSGAVSNYVRGNRIGTTPVGNGQAGVFVEGNWNWIGGTNTDEGNVIAYNGTRLPRKGFGVVIALGEHNPILGNMIWTNSGRGIDLGNDSFTVNDIGDGDTGANDLQNYPVVTHVNFYPQNGNHDITWTLNSKTNRTYRIEWFANSAPDPSGFGGGQRFLDTADLTTDGNGFAVITRTNSLDDGFISATATDLQDMNTSEFAPVDTDGDGIADAWETRGIDYNEDGIIDLVLAKANPMHKDIYIEVDAMKGFAPDANNLARVKTGTGQGDGFKNVPNSLVQNPDGRKGINIHPEIDQRDLPYASWTNLASLGVTNEFELFDALKATNFGTISQQTNANALAAKRLVYRYCIFVDAVTDYGGEARDIVASDFFVAAGTATPDPYWDEVPGSLMHELGHTLGLGHGGIVSGRPDHTNYKPNYHSIMDYLWSDPDGQAYPWRLDYSREAFATLNETNLDETVGLGGTPAHQGHYVVVGPIRNGTNELKVMKFFETGPVDWNSNHTKLDMHVVRNLNFLCKTNECRPSDAIPGDTLVGTEDWSKLRFYFLDMPGSLPGHHAIELTNDLNPDTMAWLRNLGADVGVFQFSRAIYSVSETDSVAVITVTRTFDTEGDVSVSFATINGTATNGLDYVATNGVLTFTGAESVKTFTVPILNDGIAEETETVTLVLSNATGGATLGPRATATLMITDDDPPGHFTVSSTNNSGLGSLRQAILDANASPGLAIVDFNVPPTNGFTISPISPLPTLSNRITIDGTTQPGFAGAPIIELNGANAGLGTAGLLITAGHCTVRGLVINRFGGSGISILNGGQNHIESCYIGLNRAGTLDQGNAADGVLIQSSDNVIGGTDITNRNFISGNNSSGINLTGGGTNNQVLGNVIGLGVDGSDQGNTQAGVIITASQNIIGGEDEGAGNVISGNDQDGINIASGTTNHVLGNFIGTDITGTSGRGNSGNGIKVAATGQIIGGDDPGDGNVISANGQRGIELNTAFSTLVLANKIGTDATGQNPLGNQAGGVVFKFSSQNNQLGWPLSGADGNPFPANTIAFNNGPGIAFESAFASNNVLRGNSIFSHAAFGYGIDLEGLGNRNLNYPLLTSASNSLSGTVISGNLTTRSNTSFTVDFYASSVPGKSGFGEGQSWIGAINVATDTNGNAAFTAQTSAMYLKGRYITATATDPAGNTSGFSPAITADVPVAGRTFTVVNTNDSGEGSLRQAILDANANVSDRDTIAFEIPGAGVHTIRPLSPLPAITDTVLIDGYTQPGSSANTAATGHNGVLLIELDGSLGTTTNGLRIEAGNSIVRGLIINRFGSNAASSDLSAGILLTGGGGNQIEGNFIGTDSSGFLDRGNAYRGVMIYQSSSNVIGGTVPSARNVISANHTNGGIVSGEAVLLYGDSVLQFSGNRIEGNLLGTAADGLTALGNAGCAVRLGQPVTNTTIGGIIPGAGNVIAFNAALDPPSSACGVDDPLKFGVRGIAILGNSIYSNVGLGIGGNMVNSSDGRGNFPLLNSAISSNGQTTIVGRLNSVSNATHRIEFFANDVFDPSGFGEGKTFLGAAYVATDTNGFAVFTNVLPVAVSNTMFITATATDDQNNTSEFSPRLRVGDVLTNVIIVNSINDVDDGVANTNHTSLREAIMAANNHLGPDTIRFAIGTGAKTISLSNALPALMDASTTIDATTQPGFTNKPLIYLDGLFLSPTGFRLYSPSNTIRGFAINRFSYGIYGDAAYASPFCGFNVIEGNYIGTDLTGSASAGSQDWGIYLTSSFLAQGCVSNRIGGATAAARNVISGNNRAGIYAFGCDGNSFVGNFVGTDSSGSNAVANGRGLQPIGGMFIQRCRGAVLGGSAPGAGNLVAGNTSPFADQLFLWDDCSGSVVQGNYFGTDITGRTNLGNSLTAIDITGSGFVLVKSNLLSGTGNHGGVNCGLYLASPSNRVEGNFMGTDVTGTRQIPNGPCGVFIDFTGAGNVIGGTNAASRNLISGGGYAVTIKGQSNIVQGNFIGTQINGASPLTNFFDGVLVQNSFNQIGGPGPGQGNTIAFSVGSGVNISSGTNNSVLGNSIFSNTGLGIDLGASGVTTNDPGDVDSGANNLQNFPLLSSARNFGSATLIAGTLNSRSNTAYRLEFFSNTNCHPSGFGEGRSFLITTTATTDSSGNAAFFFQYNLPIPAAQLITATATDPNNNTSEFSPCVTVINDTNYVALSFSASAPFTLTWPTSAVGFSLERSTNLNPPAIWQTISNGIATNGGSKVFVITNSPTTPAIFFRLRRP